MDIAAGSTAGRDRLRARLRAPTSAISDADMQLLWDQAVGACLPYIRPGYVTDAPEHLIGMVLAVGAHVWQATDVAPGDTLPDGSPVTAFNVSSNMVKRYLVLGGECVTSNRQVGGGTLDAGIVTW